MAKTIIQTIGPLYGEVVNGTVFGRPNGSIYVPTQNTISLTVPANRMFVRNLSNPAIIAICTSEGYVYFQTDDPTQKMNAVAQSQDNANYIQFELSQDSDFEQVIGGVIESAGQFNVLEYYVSFNTDPVFTIESGVTYYVRAQLVSGSGAPVATSDTFELEGWVSE